MQFALLRGYPRRSLCGANPPEYTEQTNRKLNDGGAKWIQSGNIPRRYPPNSSEGLPRATACRRCASRAGDQLRAIAAQLVPDPLQRRGLVAKALDVDAVLAP